MRYDLEIKEEAREDILQASSWYSDQSPGLDIKFIFQLESTFKTILQNPKTFKKYIKTLGRLQYINFRML